MDGGNDGFPSFDPSDFLTVGESSQVRGNAPGTDLHLESHMSIKQERRALANSSNSCELEVG